MASNRLHSLKSNIQTSGFTIVEVLIVLAVTGLLFVSAVLLISGRQNQTEFMTSIHSAQQQLQQIINETQSGYSGGDNFDCNGTGLSNPSVEPAGTGLDKGCSFIGKVIQFGNNAAGGDGQLTVFPLVGKQQTSSGGTPQQVQNLQSAYPTAVYGSVDGTATYNLENGLSIFKPMTSTGAIGIVSNFGAYSSGGATCNGLCSASQQFSLYTINSISANTNSLSQVASAIGASNATTGGINFSAATNPVTLCVVSGGTNQSGLLTIASDGSLAVSLAIKENKQCA